MFVQKLYTQIHGLFFGPQILTKYVVSLWGINDFILGDQ